jgi:hypothetical protein
MPRVLGGVPRGLGVFLWARYPCIEYLYESQRHGSEAPRRVVCFSGRLQVYRGYSKLRRHTVLGPYGRSIRTLLRAVRVLTFK